MTGLQSQEKFYTADYQPSPDAIAIADSICEPAVVVELVLQQRGLSASALRDVLDSANDSRVEFEALRGGLRFADYDEEDSRAVSC